MSPRDPRHRAGLTLIEILLATAIAVLVIAVVFSTFHMVSVTLRGQQERRAGPDAAARALEQLTADLAGTWVSRDDDLCSFRLTPPEPPTSADSQLSFCRSRPPDGEKDPRWFEVARVAYRVIEAPESGKALVRESETVFGPDSAPAVTTNVLAEGIERFLVSAYDGAAWKTDWSPKDARDCPRAARVELEARCGGGTRTLQTDLFIPIGNAVSSTVNRAGIVSGKPSS